jgi:hypothetical protein
MGCGSSTAATATAGGGNEGAKAPRANKRTVAPAQPEESALRGSTASSGSVWPTRLSVNTIEKRVSAPAAALFLGQHCCLSSPVFDDLHIPETRLDLELVAHAHFALQPRSVQGVCVSMALPSFCGKHVRARTLGAMSRCGQNVCQCTHPLSPSHRTRRCTAPRAQFCFDPLQWGTVRVDTTDGSGALCFDPTVHNVVVVFGGPGCSKGRVTSLLTKEYGFDLISMETVVRFLR